MTHGPCFDVPDICRGRFVGRPGGVFTERGKTLSATDIRYSSVSSQCVPTALASSTWCGRPFVPRAQAGWATEFLPGIPVAVVTQEHETELQQGDFTCAQTDKPPGPRGSPCARRTSPAPSAQANLGRRNPPSSPPAAAGKRCLEALGTWTRKEKQHVRRSSTLGMRCGQ